MRRVMISTATSICGAVLQKTLPIFVALVVNAGGAHAAGHNAVETGYLSSRQPVFSAETARSRADASADANRLAQRQPAPTTNNRLGAGTELTPGSRFPVGNANDFNWMEGGGG